MESEEVGDLGRTGGTDGSKDGAEVGPSEGDSFKVDCRF